MLEERACLLQEDEEKQAVKKVYVHEVLADLHERHY
jgi:hypothetical protein